MESVEYFKKNIESVPAHIPILVIANFRDVEDQWKISASEIRSLIEQYESVPTKDPKSVVSGDEEAPAEEGKESAAIAKDAISVLKDESKPDEVKTGSLETEETDATSKEKPSAQMLREEFDLQASDRFKGVVEEFLRRPRVIKYIETSFLEKFGLHVSGREVL